MKILDVCCGSRMFWYDKQNKDTTYIDIRKYYEKLPNGEKLETEATQTELDELYDLFLNTEKQGFCTAGDNKFDISNVERFAYKEIENLQNEKKETQTC